MNYEQANVTFRKRCRASCVVMPGSLPVGCIQVTNVDPGPALDGIVPKQVAQSPDLTVVFLPSPNSE